MQKRIGFLDEIRQRSEEVLASAPLRSDRLFAGQRGSSITYVDLSDHRLREKTDLILEDYHAYCKKIESGTTSPFSRKEKNLLAACKGEISRYIKQSRTGLDIPEPEYKSMYQLEFRNYLRTQRRIYSHGIPQLSRSIESSGVLARAVPVKTTLGAEEELQIVRSDTGELSPSYDKVIARVPHELRKFVSAEVMQSQIEIKTSKCTSVLQLKEELQELRRAVIRAANSVGLRILSAGVHPYSSWQSQRMTVSPRARLFLHDMHDVVRRLVTFGLHVHVGWESGEDERIAVMNRLRQYLPTILSLSASSPFWERRFTGLMSYRSAIFSTLPRTGIPPRLESKRHLDNMVRLLGKTRSLDSMGHRDARKIWWDIRPHPEFPTLEFRIMDACPLLDDVVNIAALLQSLVAQQVFLHRRTQEFQEIPDYIIRENKWRAMSGGTRAEFIDLDLKQAVPFNYVILETMDLIKDMSCRIGNSKFVSGVLETVARGSSAQNQIRFFLERAKSTKRVQDLRKKTALRALVNHLVDTTKLGVLE